MFERFNQKREKLLLPNFEASEQYELLVNEYDDLRRRSVGFSLDREGATDEEVDRTKSRMQELENELREYLLPYSELTQEPKETAEHLRWDVAQYIYRKGRYKDFGWENWDRSESKYRKNRKN